MFIISGWLHEGFGSYDKAFYVSGAVAIFSSVLLFGVDYMRRKYRKTYDIDHNDPICECPGSEKNGSFSNTEESAIDSSNKDMDVQPMLPEEECVNKRCRVHGCIKIRDFLLVIEKETVL